MSLHRAISTLGPVGRAPQAPGTFGSLAAIPLAWGLHWLGGFPLFALATLATTALAWIAIRDVVRDDPDLDPPEIVVDELVGQWIALWPLSLGLWLQGVPGDVFPWPGWVLGFLLFRFFDILKPPPVSTAERLGGATGILADDVVAGALAGLVTSAAAIVAHGMMG